MAPDLQKGRLDKSGIIVGSANVIAMRERRHQTVCCKGVETAVLVVKTDKLIWMDDEKWVDSES